MIQMSNNVKNIQNKIDKMPEWYKNILWAVRKGDGDKFIDQFKKNIRHNRLGLDALAEMTVKTKQRQGLRKPDTPLYGEGDDLDKTYINMFLLKKIAKGWKAYPRWAKHHKSDLQLRQLFEVHEYGRTIRRGKALIRIPPRPAAWLTYRKILAQLKKHEKSRKVKKAITEYINNGNEKLLKEVIRYNTDNIK